MQAVRWERQPSSAGSHGAGFSGQHRDLAVLPTAGDGSCALHAILQCFYSSYQHGRNPDGTPVNRSIFVRTFRNDIAEMLDKPRNGEGSATWYESLSRGTLGEFAEATKNADPDVPDLSLEGFKKHLRSKDMLGQEIFEYVSSILNVAIFILNENAQGVVTGVYSLGKESELYYAGRVRAVVILTHNNKHYSSVGKREDDGTIRTFFTMDDPLIVEFMRELS